MARNKPTSKFTINDALALNQKAEAPSKAFADELQETRFGYDEVLNEKLIEYNNSIENFDSKYLALQPRFRVLVRTFVKELQKDDNGLIIPNTIPIPIPSQSGIGEIGFVDSPWPFSQKVIVVSAPESSSLQRGDICMVENSPVTGILGKGKNVMLKVNNSFVHPDEQDKYLGGVPTDPSDPNYGYLLVNDYDLILKQLL